MLRRRLANPEILLVASGERGLRAARQFALWRALCQCGVLRRLERTADTAGLAERIAQDDAATLVIAGAGLEADHLPRPRHLIHVLLDEGDRPMAGAEIWRMGGARRGKEIGVSDAFELQPAPRETGGPIAVIAIGEGPALAARLRDLAPAVPRAEIIADRRIAPLLETVLCQSVTPVPDNETALDLAGSGTGACLLLGDPDAAEVRAWRSYLHALGRPLLGDDTGLAVDGLDPERTLRDVAAALRRPVIGDLVQRGDLVRRNLGLTIATELVTFNPWVRLFHALYDVAGDLRDVAVTGDVSHPAARDAADHGMVNAWLRPAVTPAAGVQRLRATAALGAALDPAEIRVTFRIWDLPVAELAPPEDLPLVRAGLIGVDLALGTARVHYWADAPDAALQAGKKLLQDPPRGRNAQGLRLFQAETAFPYNRDTLTVMPQQGRGQRFSQFRLFAPRQLSSARMADMAGTYAGRSAWLIGNGPSVQITDLDRLADGGHLCFGFNRFHLAHGRTRLRPAFTVTGDAQMIEDFGQDIVDQSGGEVFVASEQAPALVGDYLWLRQISVFPSLFSFDAARAVTPGGSSVYVALQIGYWLGIRRWYIYGADFAFDFRPATRQGDAMRTASGDGNHFIANYRAGLEWCPPSIENILPSFHAARLLMESDGGFVRNVTRGGHLEVFERQNFEAALAEDARAGQVRIPAVGAPIMKGAADAL